MRQQEKSPPKRMKHMSFLLCHEDRDAFRHLCVALNTTPSEVLRAIVRLTINKGYCIDRNRGAGNEAT